LRIYAGGFFDNVNGEMRTAQGKLRRSASDQQQRVSNRVLVFLMHQFVDNAGARVIATTRNTSRKSRLESLGAKDVLLESTQLAKQVREFYPEGIDAVLDIVGNTTVLDSLAMLR
jgi:hypothetical protein